MLRYIVDFVFPRVCHVCERTLADHEDFVCTYCLHHLPRTFYHLRSPNPMELRFAGLFPFKEATAMFLYAPDTAFARLVHDFKYRGFPSLAKRLGRLAGEELFSTGFFSDADIILPIPLHFFKEARRGYNQAEQIARGLSEATGIPTRRGILRARRGHRTQTSLSHAERLSNTEGVFSVRHPEELENRHIIIVDDICTTGATLSSAARAILSAAPSSRVSIFSLGCTV